MAPDINPSPLSSNPKVAGLAHAGASQVLDTPNKQTKIINISQINPMRWTKRKSYLDPLRKRE